MEENLEALITRAAHLHGQLYADLLRADIAIAERQRDNPPVPAAWIAKRQRRHRQSERRVTVTYIYSTIKDEDGINRARNAMAATGYYSVGMSDCEVVGINGDCGPDRCPVYLVSDDCSYLEEQCTAKDAQQP